MEFDWESVINEIIAGEKNTIEERKEEINKYTKFIEKYYDAPEIVKDIKDNYESILWLYNRLCTHSENHNISWKEESKFDRDLYTGMIFSAYYFQKAWSTVADGAPPLAVSRVMGYAFMVGYRLGITGGSEDEL